MQWPSGIHATYPGNIILAATTQCPLSDGTQAFIGLEVQATKSAQSGKYVQGQCGRIMAISPELQVQWPSGIHATYPGNIILGHTISVGTANVWFNQGAKSGHPPLPFIQEYLQHNPLDVLLFQETKDVAIEKLQGYQVIYNEGRRKYEQIGCILKSDSLWEVVSSEKYETKLAFTTRWNMTTTFRLKMDHSVQCTVGNVHLCGGDGDEKEHHKDTNLEHLCQTKTEMLDAMISAGTDIIAGDFNSDRTNKNAEFLRSRQWSDPQIQIWNHAPNKRLDQAGFTLVPNDQPTSNKGGIPDMIWYRPHRISPTQSGNIPMLFSGKEAFSDHDGLCASFRVVRDSVPFAMLPTTACGEAGGTGGQGK